VQDRRRVAPESSIRTPQAPQATVRKSCALRRKQWPGIDDRAPAKTLLILTWLMKRPRFSLHSTPTSSSWLNLAERIVEELL